MTETITRPDFFHSKLIPTGQRVTLLLAMLAPLKSEKSDVKAAHSRSAQLVLDLLSLVSCFSLGPIPPETLAKLDKALTHLNSVLLSVQLALGETELAKVRLMFDTGMEGILPVFYELMNYSPETRHSWIEQHLHQANALTQGRRVNRWRTWVKHGDWDATVRAMPYWQRGAALTIIRKLKTTTCAPGAKLAEELWLATFGTPQPEKSVAPPTEPGIAPPIASQSDTAPMASPDSREDLLPEGISLVSTRDGALLLTLEFHPNSTLSTAEKLVLTRGPLSKRLMGLLEVKTLVARCTVSRLPQGVASLVAVRLAWLASMTEVKVAIQEEISKRDRHALRLRLTANFTITEQAQLLKILEKKLLLKNLLKNQGSNPRGLASN
jgi:hypothetical protein